MLTIITLSVKVILCDFVYDYSSEVNKPFQSLKKFFPRPCFTICHIFCISFVLISEEKERERSNYEI